MRRRAGLRNRSQGPACPTVMLLERLLEKVQQDSDPRWHLGTGGKNRGDRPLLLLVPLRKDAYQRPARQLVLYRIVGEDAHAGAAGDEAARRVTAIGAHRSSHADCAPCAVSVREHEALRMRQLADADPWHLHQVLWVSREEIRAHPRRRGAYH